MRRLAMPPIYYGWIMLFAIMLMTFASSGSRFSFGVFVRPMSEELHWGRDQLALAASFNLILAGLLRPVVGIFADRLRVARDVQLYGIRPRLAGMLRGLR